MIQSAEEKDSLIVRLKQLAQTPTTTSESSPKSPVSQMDDSSSTTTTTTTVKSLKTEGLLKLVAEKNQQIEQLKQELCDVRTKLSAITSTTNGSSMSMMNELMENVILPSSSSSLLSLAKLGPSTSEAAATTPTNLVVKSLLECLEKEINIYKKLNQHAPVLSPLKPPSAFHSSPSRTTSE